MDEQNKKREKRRELEGNERREKGEVERRGEERRGESPKMKSQNIKQHFISFQNF
jgi:hypothetical protein